MVNKQKLRYGPLSNLIYEIPMTNHESQRMGIIVETMRVKDSANWNNPDFGKALVEAINQGVPKWLAIIVGFGFAKPSEQIPGAYEWIGKNLYMLWDLWNVIPGPSIAFNAFCSHFIDPSTKEQFTEKRAAYIGRKQNDRDRRRIPQDAAVLEHLRKS